MKKIVFPAYSVVAFLFVLLLSAFVAVADYLVDNGVYFYTGASFTTRDLYMTIFLLGCVLFVSAVVVFLQKNSVKKWLKAIIIIASCLISAFLMVIITTATVFIPNTYVELVSDDGEHCIVIGEDCYLFSPYGGDVFEKISPFTMKRLTKYEAGIDFYTPFSDGNYSVTWNEENFELFYDFDGDGEKDERILINYLP